jgi:formylglycine-generating enzyme required for sulfatase activity
VAGANFRRGRQPVINVSLDDAKTYVDWLSRLTGKTYRLLTEAEWEYAARARTTTRFSFGDDDEALGEHAWFVGNSESRTHVVGGKNANPFGLYDMHGNVSEFVEDLYVDNYNGAPADGSARTSDCNSRACRVLVLRGGSWGNAPVVLRSADRRRVRPETQSSDVGFRVVRVLSPARI